MNIQPTLKGKFVFLRPLRWDDFDRLYLVASDPLIWEQHPNKDRWKESVFKTYFEGAMLSKGAFLILEASTLAVIGCTRYYDWNEMDASIMIGYTFFGRSCWGKPYNRESKKLLLEHSWSFAEKIVFHIGTENIRSQKALEKLGAKKTQKISVAYHGEPEKLNYEYQILKSEYLPIKM